MKKKLSLLMVALMAMAAFAGLKRASETEVVWDFADSEFVVNELGIPLPAKTNSTTYIEEPITYQGITMTTYKSTTYPGFFLNQAGTETSLRVYKIKDGNKGAVEFSVAEGTSLTKIVMEGDSKLAQLICNNGTIELTNSNKTLTWTSEEGVQSVKFENDNSNNTVRINKITFTKATETGGDDPVPATETWTVVGSKDLTGANWADDGWDATKANDMTLSEGVYTWSKSDVELTGNVEFKVVKNHSWDEAYPTNNYVLNIDQPGKYDVAITFDPDSKAINAQATLKEEVVPEDTYVAAGDLELWGSAWDANNTDNKLIKGEDGKYSISKENVLLSADKEYGYKIVKNGITWIPDGEGNEKSLTVDKTGFYTVTLTVDPEALDDYAATAEFVKDINTIAEVQAAEANTLVGIEGVVMASAANGAVIKDDTDLLYYYNTRNTLTVGQKVLVKGTVGKFGGASQLTNSTVITNLGTIDGIVYPEAVELTEADFAALAQETSVERKYVTYQGTLAISGNYYNITVGESAVKGSIVRPNEDLSELNGKTVTVKGYQMYISGSNTKYVYTVATSVEEYVAPATWTVAGSSTVLFGTAWDPSVTANDMTLAEGVYTWTKEGVRLTAGNVEFKVVKNHAWGEEYPSENYVLAISRESIYDVTITFNAETKEVTAVATDKSPEPTVPEGWTNAVTNGNLDGDDVSNYVSKEAPSTDVVGARIVDGAGKNGGRGIEVKSAERTNTGEKDNNGNDVYSGYDWDTQFWIVLPEALPTGSKLHVEFDYKADKSALCNTQAHGEPGGYQHWGCIGDVNFTDSWAHFSKDIEIDDAMAKGDNGNGNGVGLKSIAFNLAVEKTPTVYNFDNFVVWYQKPAVISDWTDLVVNGNMEGDDNSCFYVTEQGLGGPYLAPFTDGIGKDGSRAVKVQSADNPVNDWDSQFFIRLPYQLPAGTKYRVSFDYKADKAGDYDTQSHAEPGQYIHWSCVGSGSSTTEWQTYENEGSIPSECDGSENKDPESGTVLFLKNFQTIAFNLAKNKVATEFIFDNVKFEVPTAVVSSLNQNPAVNPGSYPVINSMAIRGTFPGMSWGVDGAVKMTQDATNAALWTATMTNVEVEGTKYEYKAFANGVTNGYQLPAAGEPNADFVFGTSEYPAGKYDLLFTVNTDENLLTLVPTRVDEPVIEDVYTIAGTKDLTGTENDFDIVEANNMTLDAESGLYTWSAENVKVSAVAQPEFKVVKNHSWEACWPADNNWVITPDVVGGDGVYTITITFNAETNEIGVTGVKTSDDVYALGDANGDGDVTTSDAVLAVDFALEKSVPTAAQFAAADVNKNQRITVSDAVGIVNIALEIEEGQEPEPGAAGARPFADTDYLTMDGRTLSLTNSAAYTGFQMDVTLAEGALLNGVQLSERAAGMTLSYSRIGANTWRIVALSLEHNTISGNNGTLLTLDIMGNSTVSVTNVEFADAAARAYMLGFNGEVTGINSIYGISADSDVYNVNGVRTTTMGKGVNIVRTADGEVKKLFVK